MLSCLARHQGCAILTQAGHPFSWTARCPRMFFYVAKIFWFFAQPSGLLLVMMIGGAVLLRAGRDRARRRLIAASVGLMMFVGLLRVSNWLIMMPQQLFGRSVLVGL